MIFRIDDIGASTKQFEQYSRYRWANYGFLKRLPGLRAWGVYQELTAAEWEKFLKIFKNHNIKPLIAVTAAWVEKDSSLTPFPSKFPDEAQILKDARKEGKIDIANHGLTHCVVGRHLPAWRHSNRFYHREFRPELPESLHRDHILKSQKILENYFEVPIDTLVPPGNLWSIKTYRSLAGTNINKIISGAYMIDSDEPMVGIKFIDDTKGDFITFHDRELKLYGTSWLTNIIRKNQP